MKKHKLAFIDIETTGLSLDDHEIIEIGGVIVEQHWQDGEPSFEELDSFEIKVKPEHIETADPEALQINQYDESQWMFAADLKSGLQQFADKTKDCIMVAHNVSFDYMFLHKAFLRTGIENKMHYHKLDTISIAFAKLYRIAEVEKFSLRALAEYFGITNERAHTALADAKATFELYKKLMGNN